jgi:hypothetical protein
MPGLIVLPEASLCSLMLVPKCKPALFFRALPFISIDMGKRTCLVDVFFEKIELQCLIEGETIRTRLPSVSSTKSSSPIISAKEQLQSEDQRDFNVKITAQGYRALRLLVTAVMRAS